MIEIIKKEKVLLSPRHFFFMNALRAYAAVMIIVIHASSISRQLPLARDRSVFETPIWWFSVIDLFFVMSGFLIVHTCRYLYGRPGSVRIFIQKRAVRTVPLYWMFTVIIALLFLYTADPRHAEQITVLRFLASLVFWPIPGGPVILLGWTLNYEIFFYILFALSLTFPFSRGPLILTIILCLIVALGQIFHLSFYAFQFWSDPVLIDFVWGILLGALYYHGVRLSAALRLMLAVGSILPAISLSTIFENGDLARPFLFGLSAAMLVAAATLREKEYSFGLLGRLIEAVGNAAYSLYLTHIISLKAFEMLYRKSGLALRYGPISFIFIGSLIGILAGYVAYRVIEEPFSAYMRRHFLERKNQPL